MVRHFLSLLLVLTGFLVSAFAQDGTQQPRRSEADVAATKRRGEIIAHPTATITLRLASIRRDVPNEAPSTTPSPYTADQWLHFESFITQNSGEDLVIWGDRDPYYAYRPELIRDGDAVLYMKQAADRVERAEREPSQYSSAPSKLQSGREYQSNYVQLEDWYESPLPLGHYQLIIRKRFALKGDWVESNPVTFDVIPRRAAFPIPDGLHLRLVPERLKEHPNKPYRLGYDDAVTVEMVNDSDQRVYVSVIDRYYGHRPQLIKDGQVVPYSDEIKKLIEFKEKDPRMVEVVNGFYIDPKAPPRVEAFSLKQWYGPLAPGTYHLTDRRRFEIGGPWTRDSVDLVIEIVP
jgi:hypothetical protein